MVISGVANAVWGEPRVTLDVDITVAATAAEAPKILKALGAQVKRAPDDPVDFAEHGVLPFIHANGPKVEFAFGMATYVHRAVERAVEIISERQKDRDDVVGIFIHRRAALDREYLDPRVHELAVVLERPEIEERYRELVEGK